MLGSTPQCTYGTVCFWVTMLWKEYTSVKVQQMQYILGHWNCSYRCKWIHKHGYRNCTLLRCNLPNENTVWMKPQKNLSPSFLTYILKTYKQSINGVVYLEFIVQCSLCDITVALTHIFLLGSAVTYALRFLVFWFHWQILNRAAMIQSVFKK